MQELRSQNLFLKTSNIKSIPKNIQLKPCPDPIFLVAQMVKCLLAMQETWVQFLGREDPLEKEMAIHSSTLAWKIPWTDGYSPWGHKESAMTEQLHFTWL